MPLHVVVWVAKPTQLGISRQDGQVSPIRPTSVAKEAEPPEDCGGIPGFNELLEANRYADADEGEDHSNNRWIRTRLGNARPPA
jgi:hypothetical protein